MRVISVKALRDFSATHKAAETALNCWYRVVKAANWQSLNDIRKDFPSVDYVAPNRYIFNIKGNHYRLVVVALFSPQIVYIRFVGTHAEYDKVNVKTI